MAATVITVTVTGAPNLREASDRELRYVVVKMPGCCKLCAANEDPEPILAGGVHVNCRCEVEIEEE